MATAECLVHAARIIHNDSGFTKPNGPRLAVVVSAMARVTNLLVDACAEALRKDGPAKAPPNDHPNQSLKQAIQQHKAVRDVLLNDKVITREAALAFTDRLTVEHQQLERLLASVRLCGVCPPAFQHAILGYGELWSSRLLFAILQRLFHGSPLVDDTSSSNSAPAHGGPKNDHNQVPSDCLFCRASADSTGTQCQLSALCWLDARELIIIKDPSPTYTATQDSTTHITVADEPSKERTRTWLRLHPHCRIVVVPGFICSTEAGIATTLQRNGSDFSGSILAELLDAQNYTIWKDVEGIYAAHPHHVGKPHCLSAMSYAEATELAAYGAQVLHPRTMDPCVKANVPIVLRSSDPPPIHQKKTRPLTSAASPISHAVLTSSHGTTIGNASSLEEKGPKAFTFLDDVAIVGVHGTPLLSAATIAARTYSAISSVAVPLLMASQGSSEGSIGLVLPRSAASTAANCLQAAFQKEIQYDTTMSVTIQHNLALLCAVGDGMQRTTDTTLGLLTNALAAKKINIHAVSQGCSLRTIIFVIDQHRLTEGLQALHHVVYPSPVTKTLRALAPSIASPRETSTMSGPPAPKVLDHTPIHLVCLLPDSTPLSLVPATPSLLRWATAFFTLAQRAKILPAELEQTPFIFSGFTDGKQFVSSDASTTTNAMTLLHSASQDQCHQWVLLDIRFFFTSPPSIPTSVVNTTVRSDVSTTTLSPDEHENNTSSDTTSFPHLWYKATHYPVLRLKESIA